MSMSVDKVSNIHFTGTKKVNKNNTGIEKYESKSIQNSYNENYNNVSNNQMRNAAKALFGLYMLGVAAGATSAFSSCAKAEAWAEADDSLLKAILDRKDSCCCCCPTQVIHDKDTLWLHDSIPQIIEHHDTIRIKPDFKSPVIDTLNMILHDLGNDTTGGYIPLKVSFVDEMDTKYKDHIFDGQSSAPNNVFYDAKHSPWSDEECKFIIGTPLDEPVKYMLNLTGDGKLYVTKMIPKNGVTNPKGLDDYMYAFDSYVFDRDQAEKLVRKFNVAREQVGREYAGTLEKTALPKTIMLTNPYGTEWRWTNFNVVRGDAPTNLED